MTTFNYLNTPDQYNQYFTKYPEGYTILEALLNWVQDVNNLVDNVNNWNTRLDDFVKTFDADLQGKVTETLQAWQQDGTLDVIINQALQTQIDDITNPKKIDIGAFRNVVTDISDFISQKITEGYNWFIIPKRTKLNKTLMLKNVHNILFEGTGGFEPEFALNTGGIGILVEGSSFIRFKNFTIASRIVTLSLPPLAGMDNPSKIGIMYTRSLEEDSCQWNNSDTLSIYMHTDPAANSGRGTIGLYNCTAESQAYHNLTSYADNPEIITRTDIFNIAVKRSASMKAVHHSGVTTLISSYSHALILEGISDITFDNLYMAKDLYYGVNNEQYACLITGVESQGWENYNLVMTNYDAEEFESGFKVVSRLRHSKIFGNQHNAPNRIISVEAEGILDSCDINIQTTSASPSIEYVYFAAAGFGAINCQFFMMKPSFLLNCYQPIKGCTVYSETKPTIVNNHGGEQSVNVVNQIGLGFNENYINFKAEKPSAFDGSAFSTGQKTGNFAFNTAAVQGGIAGWIAVGTEFYEVGQVGHRAFDHNPTGVETPVRVGEEVFNWMGPTWYKSVGLTSADWRAMTV